MPSKRIGSRPISTACDNDDDDFQETLAQTPKCTTSISKKQNIPLKPSNHPSRLPKKHKAAGNPGKENNFEGCHLNSDKNWSLESIPSTIDCSHQTVCDDSSRSLERENKMEILTINEGYLRNSVESRLLRSTTVNCRLNEDSDEEEDTELDVLLKLCEENDRNCNEVDELVRCPLCGIDISDLNEELKQVHTNNCLDKCENQAQDVVFPNDDRGPPIEVGSGRSPRQVVDVSPVVRFLDSLGLGRYEDAFVQEEIDWDTLQWLTEEDLIGIGITALGPRKKIVHALSEIRKGRSYAVKYNKDAHMSDGSERQNGTSKLVADGSSKPAANKLITDFFPGFSTDAKKICNGQNQPRKIKSSSGHKPSVKNRNKNGKFKDTPTWCCVPGTPFRVDAFKYLRGDCSHWFLTHFHMDRLTRCLRHERYRVFEKRSCYWHHKTVCYYQGLTRSFCHGKIYCSLITARLVNMKIGIAWDRLQVLPLNQKITIAGIHVTCLEANHCPGSIIILFEPTNDKAVLHTGDFRFIEEMTIMPALQTCPIHTLILDTTYCNPEYDFPKQEAVIQFVIEAIQAEVFNPKTLFLIGSYTIGKERLFLEVARVLHKKVYVNAAKFRILQCLDFSEEDMRWFTMNERESHIHVVPMWTLASFKRLQHLSNQYTGRFSLIVAFSPTGWTFSKGKKKSAGRRWQQGTIIRYEVPYSEHCSFTELKEFVKFVRPENIIPSVNNDGPDSADAMVSLLLS